MNTIIFDLDGTLLPLDNDIFEKLYFHALAQKFVSIGYTQPDLIKAVWAGTIAMMNNDGSNSNESVFWETFTHLTKIPKQDIEAIFEAFYLNEFLVTKNASQPTPYARQVIEILQNKGYELVLATNPLFPRVATHQRIKWAGLEVEDFKYITTYENSSYCKPNLKYYDQVLQAINKQPHECIMIGNDAREDMVVSKIGIKTFLLINNLINKDNIDINQFEHGGWSELLNFITNLPSIM